MDPCKQEKIVERLDGRVTELERQFTKLSNSDAETKIYLETLIKSNDDIKMSIKEMQIELKDISKERVPNESLLQAIEAIQSNLESQETSVWKTEVLPQVVGMAKWVVLFAAALAGIKLTL